MDKARREITPKEIANVYFPFLFKIKLPRKDLLPYYKTNTSYAEDNEL
jgi:hypothetical protein